MALAAARRVRERTYPELAGSGHRARLVVFAPGAFWPGDVLAQNPGCFRDVWSRLGDCGGTELSQRYGEIVCCFSVGLEGRSDGQTLLSQKVEAGLRGGLQSMRA